MYEEYIQEEFEIFISSDDYIKMLHEINNNINK